ncbi:outer membrane efflux protein [Candidatus Koribacter versatilis Ellin345]|uniref:Outer membrane efflux protein n=1 Tax=Koribacter versatilis (strain Ellin345) TaxID=204669 RepID=Q1IUY6_KORVE|nr:TolC family protein [Candidatus Koribacter versatilis]ABF39314.1 outer membrane efflux protein [Candidatus Koribacter versatilis Ellin345]
MFKLNSQLITGLTLALCALVEASAQTNPAQSPMPTQSTDPPTITLQDAIALAQKSEPGYATAVADHVVAAADRTIARSALLPQVQYNNQMIYTQPARLAHSSEIPPGAGQLPRFIANNAVHEYVSQGLVSETIGLSGIAAYEKSNAAAALAAAKLEVARRGLVVTVVRRYYDALAADRKLIVAADAAKEGNRFYELTTKLEQGREVAHADVVKAHIEQQQRQRELADVKAEAERARLELGVLLFPDPRSPYLLEQKLNNVPALPDRAEFQAQAEKNNVDLRAAMASLRVAEHDVTAAKAGFLPDLSVEYGYGIDAEQFAVNSPDGFRNLGYAISGTVKIPVWDWFATPARVKQSKIRRTQAHVELTAAQRQLIADIEESYTEAQTAHASLDSLEQSSNDTAESLRLTDLRYRAGESTVLEVVDAENTFVQAQNAHVDGAVRYAVALSNLQTLTGSLPQ